MKTLAIALALLLPLAHGSEAPPSAPGASAAPLRPGEGRLRLAVGGMSCSACAEEVAAALRQVAGVHAVEVSLANRLAIVVYELGKVSPAKLREAVARAGYEPGEVEPG